MNDLIWLAQAAPEVTPQPAPDAQGAPAVQGLPDAQGAPDAVGEGATSTGTQVITQPGGPERAPTERPGWLGLMEGPFFPLLLAIVVLYFFVFRSKRKQDRERQTMLSALKKGDRVQTIGGIIASVVEARETDVLLKVDETNNTKVRFTRSAIHRVLDNEK